MVRGLTVTFVVFCLVAGLIVGTTIWLFYTSNGADFALRHLSRQLDVQYEISQLDGSLARGVTVKDLVLEQANASLKARLIQLNMTVSSLSPFHLTFSILTIEDVTLVLPPEESTEQQAGFHLQLPQLPAMLDLLQVDIAHLYLKNMTIVQGDDISVIEELKTTLDFHQRRLSISGFSLIVDELSVIAAATLDMADPALDLVATVENIGVDQPWKTIIVENSLTGFSPDVIAGSINIQLQLVDMAPFVLQAKVNLGKNILAFEDLLFHQLQRHGSITSAGQLEFGEDGPALTADVLFQDIDLSLEAGFPLAVTGEVGLGYAQMQYQGQFDLITRGDELVTTAIAASFSGDHRHLQLEQISAAWLSAQITGSLDLGWLKSPEVRARLQIENLSLESFLPDSNSLLNANLSADYQSTEQSPQAQFNLELYDSILYGYPLVGVIEADYEDNNLIVHQLNLLSNSAQLQAQGDLQENIDFTLTLQQIADLYPPAGGFLQAQGRLNHRVDGFAADVHLAGSSFSYDQWQLSSLDAYFNLATDQTLSAAVQLQQLGSRTQTLLVDAIDLQVAGSLFEHRIGVNIRALEMDIDTALQATWSGSLWTALLQHLDINTGESHWRLGEPATIAVGSQMLMVSDLRLDAGEQQSVRLQGEFLPVEESLNINLDWSELSLGLFSYWLDPALVQGHSGGSLSVHYQPENTRIQLTSKLNANLNFHQLHLQETYSALTLDWGAEGLTGDIRVDIGSPAHLQLRFHSPEPAGLVLPDKTNLELACRHVPLQLAQPWLPSEMVAQGIFTCAMDGWWSAENVFALHGSAGITAGSLYWNDGEQSMDVDLEDVAVQWAWEGEFLRTQSTIVHDFGHMNSSFEIALPARLPFSLSASTSMAADTDFLLRESGLLSVFFPQYVYDSKGDIELTAMIKGTVGEPVFGGNVSLKEAELYVPTAGIRIADIQFAAQLEGQQLNVSTLQLSSGQGTINGHGSIDFLGWTPENFHFSIAGTEFQLINLSELAIQISPDLVVDGNLDMVRIRGNLTFPQVMVKDQTSSQVVQNSPDLVIIDRQSSDQSTIALRHDIDVNLILGEQVLLDVAGLQALVAGSLRLYSDMQQDVAAQGRLFVERGRFSSYGVSLDIERGDLYFAGVPLRYPTLDILAIRRAGQVRAGVRVTGTPQEPQVSLYSEPTMPDADVLSYVVLGRPLDSSGGDTDLLMVATGALLSQGESIILQERLKGRLGLDVLEFSAGDGDTNDAVITTGKYITPDLYVSLGYSLFNNSNEIRIRYRLSSRLDLESSFGQESGIDLFYRLERK